MPADRRETGTLVAMDGNSAFDREVGNREKTGCFFDLTL